MAFDLIIFDNDGVLVDSEPHATIVLAELLAEYGLPLSHDDIVEQFIGTSLNSVRRSAEDRLGRRLPHGFEERYHEALFDRFRQHLRPIPGIEQALHQISIPICVASSGSHERIRLALTLTGLLDLFEDRIFSATDVARGKPAPDLFLYAAEQCGATPARCAVIEDSPYGIEAANRAGMTSFGYAGMVAPDRLIGATGGVFQDMRGLPALLSGAT